MHVLVGVDESESVGEISGWVESLRFANLTQEWMHVVPSQASTVWSLDPIVGANRTDQLEERLAGRMQRSLTERAEPHGETVKVRVRIGNQARELLNRADETRAELIAVRGSNKGGIAAFFIGSVARALVEGAEQSVLLTRGPVPQEPLKVLVATDHSEYMEKALARLSRWAPQGIGRLTLLHVLPPAYRAATDHLAQEIAHEVYGRPIQEVEEVTAKAATVLGQSLGLTDEAIDSRIARGSISEAIDTALAETGADLLILGAKGQTLLERLTLGSVSFRAVTTCHKSVLVLRG